MTITADLKSCIHMHGQYVRILQLLGQKCRCALPYDCMCTLHVRYKAILLAKLHSNWYCIQNIVIFLTHGNSRISTFVSTACNAIYILKPHSAYDVNDHTKFILALTRFITNQIYFLTIRHNAPEWHQEWLACVHVHSYCWVLNG